MVPKRPSPHEPVSDLARIPIVECGEPLVDFTKECPGLIVARPVFEYTRATLVRKTVADMLNRAVAALPRGFHLGIIEGWRPRYIQRRMYLTSWLRFRRLHPDWTELTLKRVVNRYVAPPDSKVPPPHSTGGAVDVVLVDENGERLDHHSPYEPFDPKSYSAFAKGLSAIAERHRAILREAMLVGGMTNYPSEYWHWSYGDQGWAYRQGNQVRAEAMGQASDGAPSTCSGVPPFAIYGLVERPEGWTPVPEDDVDEPLVRLWAASEASGFPRFRST